MAENIHIKHAVALAEKGEPDLAIESLRPILRDKANRGLKYATLAYCHEKKKAYPEAIYLYSCALPLASDNLGSSWTKLLADCRRRHSEELKMLDGILAPRRYEIAAWAVFAGSLLLTLGFLTFLIPLTFGALFDILMPDGLIWGLAILFCISALASAIYCLHCFQRRREHKEALKLANGDDYSNISHKCPACDLRFHPGVIECPWCGFEKEIEEAKRLSETGDYASAYVRQQKGGSNMTEETKRCPFCAEEILVLAPKCKHCGLDLGVHRADAQEDIVSEGWGLLCEGSFFRRRVLPVLVAIVALCFFGNNHIITGGSVGPKVVRRESFGFSEILIDVNAITGMPWISAQSRFPLGCRVLKREGIIESDDAFKERSTREAKQDFDKAMRDAQEETERLLRDMQKETERLLRDM